MTINEEVKITAKEWLDKAIGQNESALEKETDKFMHLYISYNALYTQSTKILAENNDGGLISLKDKKISKIQKLKKEMYELVINLDTKNCDDIKKKVSENLVKIRELEDERKQINKQLKEQTRKGDKVSATENIGNFLGQEKLYSLLIKQERKINLILNLLEENNFYCSTKKDNSTADFEEDQRLFTNIKNHFKEEEENEQKKFNESLLTLIYATRCNMFHGQKQPTQQLIEIFQGMNSILESIIREILENY